MLGLAVSATPGSAAGARSERATSASTYTNPVTKGYSIDFPDPAIMRGKDGTWYAYATGGPYDEQGTRNDRSKIAASDDLVHWRKVGPFFASGHEPPYAAKGTGFWARDIRYLNGRYLLYFTVQNTKASEQGFDHVAVGHTRIVEFGKETVFEGRRSWGGGLVGPPGDTAWLRLHHTIDPKTGEHRFRAGSSTDGEHWTWGLTWTLPADAEPRIGLVSQGSLPETTKEHGPATARFDYLRVYR
ncbi:MAG: family 43 glycosylhydrolase [Streptosporangiales bacterium]